MAKGYVFTTFWRGDDGDKKHCIGIMPYKQANFNSPRFYDWQAATYHEVSVKSRQAPLLRDYVAMAHFLDRSARGFRRVGRLSANEQLGAWILDTLIAEEKMLQNVSEGQVAA